MLSQPTKDLAVCFFFTKYAYNESPSPEAYYSWLTQAYCRDPPNYAPRAAIEATGMAGISNISYAPQLAAKSKEWYGRALSATKQCLSHPVDSVAETTLMAVILLGLFEVC